jgi:hypothetical protein
MSEIEATLPGLIKLAEGLVESIQALRRQLDAALEVPEPKAKPEPIPWTDEDAARLGQHVERWRHLALDPAGPTDRDAVRTTVATIYEKAGMNAPVILFCGSPHALEVTDELIDMRMQTHRRARRRDRSLPPPRHGMRPSPRRRADMRTTAAEIPLNRWLDIVQNVRLAPAWAGGQVFAVRRGGGARDFGAFDHWKADQRMSARQWIADAFPSLPPVPGTRGRPEHPVFAEHMRFVALAHRVARPMLGAAAFYAFVGDFLESIDEGEDLEGNAISVPIAEVIERAGGPALEAQAMLAHAAGVVLFRERVALVADRPTSIHLDEQDRLHGDGGPALTYPDGSEVYAVHGVRVSQAVFEGRVTVDMIDSEPNVEVRRVMMERFGGVERFMSAAGATEVHRDECGVLLERTFKVRSTDSRRVVAVRVKNSTPEPDGTFKDYVLQVPPNTRTAREGVAWTFGLDAKDYRPAMQT